MIARREVAVFPSSLHPVFLLAWFGLLSCFAVAPASAQGVPLIRVALKVDASIVRISSEGPWGIGIHRSGLAPTAVAGGEAWAVEPGSGGLEVYDEFGRYRGTVADTLYAFPEVQEFHSIEIDGKRFRGQVLLWEDAGRLTAVNVVDLESYLMGVLPIEIGSQTPERMEALKAQAVAARSYTLAHMGRWRDRGFDVMGTIEDQAYGGLEGESERCTAAVEETRGVVAVHGGDPIHAYYSSTCGGHTADPVEVWNRGAFPYLRGIRDRTDRVEDSFCVSSPRYRWEEEWSGAQFEAMLDQNLPASKRNWSRAAFGPLRDLHIRTRTASMRVAELVLEFENGEVILGGDALRWTLRRPDGGALRSAMLERVGAQREGGHITRVKIVGRGFGHGVGMCQFGALGMSESGYTYPRILQFYYRDTGLRRYY